MSFNPITAFVLAALMISTVGCSSMRRYDEAQPPPPSAEQETPSEAPVAAPTETTAGTMAAAENEVSIPETMKAGQGGSVQAGANSDMQIMLKTADGKKIAAPQPSAEGPLDTPMSTSGSMAAPASTALSDSVPAEKALGWLKNGNRRFVRGSLRADGQSKADIRRVAARQKPHSIILSCADSRVPPEVIFDQKLGEIFVLRTWGPSVDSSIVAGAEHAVRNLGTTLLVVMTHNGDSHGMGDAASELAARSDVIRTALESGELKIQPAVYDLNTGVVDFQ